MKLATRRLLGTSVMAAALLMTRTAAAHDDATTARVKADAAIQAASEALETATKGGEAVTSQADHREQAAARRQQDRLDRGAAELKQAQERYAAGDHTNARHHAEKAAEIIRRASATQSGGR